ncbi:MAG: RlmE family RNA methyltransferase [Deltaproteobacteria bacterium]|nr:RlmE family RNA methyltransferase [Deltaproteobacteria bacterium]
MSYQPKDPYYRRAKTEGYRSRAAYKLLELNQRFHLIKSGDRVVDLGAAPGGWLQVAARLAGEKGKVLGVDIQPIEPLKGENVGILQGDVTAEECQKKIVELLGALADCVLSDLSPRLSGIRDADVSRSAELVRSALEIACRLLRPGGNFLVKTFVGGELNSLCAELKRRFRALQRARPESTRKGSSEIYLCARGFQKADFHSALAKVRQATS